MRTRGDAIREEFEKEIRSLLAKPSVLATVSTCVDSKSEGSAGLQKVVRSALNILGRLGLRPATASERLERGLETLRAAGKLAPTEDQIVRAALAGVTG